MIIKSVRSWYNEITVSAATKYNEEINTIEQEVTLQVSEVSRKEMEITMKKRLAFAPAPSFWRLVQTVPGS